MRRLLSPLLLLLLASAPLHAAKKGKRGRARGPYGASSRVVRNAEAKGEALLRVRSIDLQHRLVVVEVGGFPRPPAGNLFTFTDDRGRKFIAIDARCEEPFPSGLRICDLTTPEGYERHPWVKIELHLHGLASSTVAAPAEEVERAYEAARALAEVAPEAAPPKAAPPAASPTPPAAPAPPSSEDGEGEVEDDEER